MPANEHWILPETGNYDALMEGFRGRKSGLHLIPGHPYRLAW